MVFRESSGDAAAMGNMCDGSSASPGTAALEASHIFKKYGFSGSKRVTPHWRFSNAMAVAERLGLPRKIMERAKALLGGGVVQVDRLMARLSDQESELKENEMKISSRWQRLKSEQTEFERNRRREAALRRSETEAFLKQLRRDADDLLGEIRAAGDTEAAKRLAREKIRGLKERADEAFPPPAETEESAAPPFVRLGDTVRLRATGGSKVGSRRSPRPTCPAQPRRCRKTSPTT